MKVKMIRNAAAALGCKLSEGQTGEVEDSLGNQLLELGVAERLDTPAPPPPVKLETVPDEPVIAEAKKPAVKGKGK